MFNLKMLGLGLLLPMLIGCSSDPTLSDDAIKHLDAAKSQMLGMSKDETFTCVGLPEKKIVENKIEIWSYSFDRCVVDLTIASDEKVKDVRFSIKPDPKAKPTDDPVTEEEQCAKVPTVIGCLRWVRH